MADNGNDSALANATRQGDIQIMTLKLVLLRHAKTQADFATGRDFDRALTLRGKRDCTRLAAELGSRRFTADAVVCSPARRTRQTFAGLRRALRQPAVSFPPCLYLASPRDLMSVIRAQRRTVKSLVAIAHNPGLHALAVALCGDRGRRKDIDRLYDRFPTCTWCEIAFDLATWRLARRGAGRLVRLLRPRDMSD